MGKKETPPSSSLSRSKDKRNPLRNPSQKQKRHNNDAIKKSAPQKKKSNDKAEAGTQKIHYVLNPKKVKEKLVEVKVAEQLKKQKSYQTQKRKRNSAFLKTTGKGQPVLNARMKVLYSQIQKSFGSGAI